MLKTRVALINFLAFFAFMMHSYAEDYGKVSSKKVAEGIYLFTTTPYGDVGMSGNCVAIIAKDSVIVFDSAAIPQTAETILTEIRKLTDKPVRIVGF